MSEATGARTPVSPDRDKDAALKLRAARYLWTMGYVCPMEVAVSGRELRQGTLKRYDLTDLDVVGIRFDDDLSHRTVIADCKSGKNSAITRLFWLRGVMEFFGADRGYLVQPHIGRECREVALRLSISLLDNENLEAIEEARGLKASSLRCFSLQGYDREQVLWGLRLPKGHQATTDEQQLQLLYTYLGYGYWFGDEYRNIQQLLKLVADSAVVVNQHLDRPRAKVLAYTALTLWSISLLKMCGSVIATKSSDIHNEVRRYIFGGASGAAERGKLMTLFSQITKERVPLEPDYYESLLELVVRVVRYAHLAKDIPRYADLVLGENVICEQPHTIEVLLGKSFSIDALKLAKDVAHFICKATGLDVALFSELTVQ